jgi:tetratricopeptide (TPR) repeat protein
VNDTTGNRTSGYSDCLIRQRRYTILELETSLANGGVKPYFHMMAKKAKEHGNEKYQESARNRQMLETALAAYTVAIAMALPDDPEKFLYYLNRAQMFLERKMYAEAMIDCRRALALQPDHAKSRQDLP